ncbi:MAG: TatD family hydrolase [Nitrososphaerales archaeon]
MEDFAIRLIVLRKIDAHAHLDEPSLDWFATNLRNFDGLLAISDSVDIHSSSRNIELAANCDSIIPFIGIHPEIFARPENAKTTHEKLDEMIAALGGKLEFARGIGEIGLDPTYGPMKDQEYLLRGILSLVEHSRFPITLHCRETVVRILDIVSTYNLRSKILFHWFAGSESELKKLHGGGIYSSFGPSILFSKRMADLVKSSDPRFILAETDAPTAFRSLIDAPSTPFLVDSVAFKIGLILNISYQHACQLMETNATRYLSTQD